MDLSIIIVNYNTANYANECIRSVFENIGNLSYEIIIIDNSSQVNEFQHVKLNNLRLSYTDLGSNKGFGFACNRGAEKATGKVLLFLNPDIIVEKDSIDNLFDFLRNKDDAGFVTGILTDLSGEISYFYNYFPHLSWEFKEAFGLSVDNSIRELNNVEEIKTGKYFRIDWAHGACLMIKKDVFQKTKGFDENIFLYYEDVDIQKQVTDLKYNNYCFPKSKFIHFTRSSVRSIKGMRIYYFYMHFSKLYYMKKYFPFWKRILVRSYYLLGYSSKIVMLPFRKKYSSDKSIMFNMYILVLSVYMNLKRNVE